jgi:hypothetical protein
MDIVKLEERLKLIDRVLESLEPEFEETRAMAREWRRLSELSDRKLKVEYEKDPESPPDISLSQYRDYCKSVTESWEEEVNINHKRGLGLIVEKVKCREMIEKYVLALDRINDRPKSKEYEHELCKRLVNDYMSHHNKVTKEEAIIAVSEQVGKSFDAVKRAVYYPGKLQKKIRNPPNM